MNKKPSRRRFIKTVGAAASVAIIVPRDVEVDGKPTAPRAETEVRLGSATLSVKREKRQ